jgi:uncharacterized integral membrane protein
MEHIDRKYRVWIQSDSAIVAAYRYICSLTEPNTVYASEALFILLLILLNFVMLNLNNIMFSYVFNLQQCRC